jgi:hypothetical protein
MELGLPLPLRIDRDSLPPCSDWMERPIPSVAPINPDFNFVVARQGIMTSTSFCVSPVVVFRLLYRSSHCRAHR